MVLVVWDCLARKLTVTTAAREMKMLRMVRTAPILHLRLWSLSRDSMVTSPLRRPA